jgi:NADH-quinone oxidoreductase subunit H
MLAVSLLASILFFGGWNGPIPIMHMIGWAYDSGAEPARITGYIANLLGMTNMLIKGMLAVTVMMWVRWTLPRLRIDQVMKTCLKYCTPIASVMFVCVVIWQFVLPGGLFKLGESPGVVRETFIDGGGRLESISPREPRDSLADSKIARSEGANPQ